MMWTGLAICIVSTIAIIVMVALKIILDEAYPMGIPTITVLVLFMILADALHYAKRYKPRGVVDLATLTGAC